MKWREEGPLMVIHVRSREGVCGQGKVRGEVAGGRSCEEMKGEEKQEQQMKVNMRFVGEEDVATPPEGGEKGWVAELEE